ncbi:MAG: Hsp70 family protein, partial [Endomicrobium sp.]|nr:Hsp70 family protein [Endomicrobium sp.]
EQYASEDIKHKEEIEIKNEADNLVYSVEKNLREHGDKILTDDRLSIEQALTATKDALKNGDLASIKSTKDELTKVSYKLAEAIYKSSQGKDSANSDKSQHSESSGDTKTSSNNHNINNSNEKVVDAEVIDDKEKK